MDAGRPGEPTAGALAVGKASGGASALNRTSTAALAALLGAPVAQHETSLLDGMRTVATASNPRWRCAAAAST